MGGLIVNTFDTDSEEVMPPHSQEDLALWELPAMRWKDMLNIKTHIAKSEIRQKIMEVRYGPELGPANSEHVVQHSQKFRDVESSDGYRPCDQSIIVERVQALENIHAELVKPAVEQRSRLEESCLLWQFYWDLAEVENWVKKMQQILLQADIGQDLTTINLLLSRHRTLETGILSHESALQVSISGGDELIQQGHFGRERIQERIQDVMDRWTHLIGLMDDRKKRLTDAVDFHQFFTDADDVDNWMLDILKLVSSDDIGKDESNVQTLLKKH